MRFPAFSASLRTLKKAIQSPLTWLSCSALLACSPIALASTPPTVQAGTLTIASDLTYPPYAYFQDKVPAGFDADFSRLMAKHLNLDANIVDTRFADLVVGLRANRFDVVASALYMTPERAKLISYVPYLKTGSSLIALSKNDQRPANPEMLCGLKVSTIKAASWTPKLERVSQSYCKAEGKPAITVLEFPTSPEALMALRSSAADVMMEDSAVAHQLVQTMKGELTVTSPELLYTIVIALGVNQRNPELSEALTQALLRATESGEYAQLLEQYGLAAPTEADIASSLAAQPQ
ncbi:ABC transporter substrate-binding protein [Paenalcaligenes suwonensis]|uniref:ABC transporter substrate-binding protein n=1 Tax=Paenalcaligenes suwonensis TaxID=1202713 RepID=UPI001409BE95|nr:ABC transporter substrate-binding protein [Paenalcaligenes suwonensis]NHC61392.1 ABC transporter substrate-binding protein [Paenalcaligenes suwonensis]